MRSVARTQGKVSPWQGEVCAAAPHYTLHLATLFTNAPTSHCDQYRTYLASLVQIVLMIALSGNLCIYIRICVYNTPPPLSRSTSHNAHTSHCNQSRTYLRAKCNNVVQHFVYIHTYMYIWRTTPSLPLYSSQMHTLLIQGGEDS